SITGAGTIKVDAATTVPAAAAAILTLNTATINGAAITDNGVINLTGTDIVENGTLVLAGALNASGSDHIDNEIVTNTGALEVKAGGTLTLDQSTSITGAGTIKGDAATTVPAAAAAILTLNTATINGAAITDNGVINLTGTDIVENGTLVLAGARKASGSDHIDNEIVTNTGALEVKAGGTLTLDQSTSITGAGTIKVDAATTVPAAAAPLLTPHNPPTTAAR